MARRTGEGTRHPTSIGTISLTLHKATSSEIAAANKDRHKGKKYPTAGKGQAEARAVAAREQARLFTLATHPDERVVRALFLENPEALSKSPAWLGARVIAFMSALSRARRRNEAWNPLLDLLESGGWQPRNTWDWRAWRQYGLSTPYPRRRNKVYTPSSDPLVSEMPDADPPSMQAIRDRATHDIQEVWQGNLEALSSFKSRSLQASLARAALETLLESQARLLARNPDLALETLNHAARMSTEKQALRQAGIARLIRTVGNHLAKSKGGLPGGSANALRLPLYALSLNEPWKAWLASLRKAQKAQNRSTQWILVYAAARGSGSWLNATQLDLLAREVVALKAHYTNTGSLMEGFADAPQITAKTLVFLLRHSQSKLLRRAIARHTVSKDRRITGIMSGSRDTLVARAVATRADTDQATKMVKRMMKEMPETAVDVAREREDVLGQLEAEDIIPAAMSDNERIRLKALGLLGGLAG